MTTQTVTKQDWRVVEDGSYRQVRDAEGRFMAGVGDTNWREGGEDVEARAHLIASAPALLAALEAVNFHDDHEDCLFCDTPEGEDHISYATCSLILAAIRAAREEV